MYRLTLVNAERNKVTAAHHPELAVWAKLRHHFRSWLQPSREIREIRPRC